MTMTDFEKKVLRVVAKIPTGEVRSYKWVAKKCGKPKASRAVANALGKNPYPLFIPCHRVVKSSKEGGGYSLGPQLKAELIKLEKKIKDMIE
jgi:methylated-DNA-[protein]-cysteine S-methyltransferase